MKTRKAIYAGTFDVLTIGHLWMIHEGSKLFDELVVAIGVNPEKRTLFSLEERLTMLNDSTKRLPNVSLDTFTNKFLIDHAKKVGADYIIRGIRNENDYTYERTMRNVNGDLNKNVTTIFLIPLREITEVSSSMVKGLVGPHGWEKVVRKYVPAYVFKKIKEKHAHRKRNAHTKD